MKRVLLLILVLALCLGLCACGPSEEEVKDAIIKETWLGHGETEYSKITYLVNFSNSNWATIDCYYSSTGTSNYWEGTYEIRNDQIIVSDSDSGRDFFIDYTYSSGEISMTLNDGDRRVPLSVVPDGYM